MAARLLAVIHNVICYGNKLLVFSEWQLVRLRCIKLAGLAAAVAYKSRPRRGRAEREDAAPVD